jgi:hypothetical protein
VTLLVCHFCVENKYSADKIICSCFSRTLFTLVFVVPSHFSSLLIRPEIPGNLHALRKPPAGDFIDLNLIFHILKALPFPGRIFVGEWRGMGPELN